MKQAEVLTKESLEKNLCCHCGVCAGVCPTGAIKTENNVLSIDEGKCVDCGACLYCCPAGGYELSDLNLEDIKEIPRFSVAAKDENVSKDASSGGFVTQSLLSLLENGEITGAAVVVAGDSLDESAAKFVVTDDPEVILSARRSKYTQATIDGVIDYIKKNEGRYAVVGLPCQLYGLTKAMSRNATLKKRVAYKFGMVCGYTYDEECIDGLIKVMGLKKNNVKRILGWREGGLPGSFSLELCDGTTCSLPFADEHSVDVTYFAQNRCKLCKDCLCEHGDVVCADIGGWKNKKTLLLVRTAAGKKLITTLKKYDTMEIENGGVVFDKTVIPFMLREKRTKVNIRIKKSAESPKWIGGYSPKLLLSQKLEIFFSMLYERKARLGKGRHSAKQMLRIGHRSYHKTPCAFFLKVIFKLQQYLEKALKIISSKAKQTAEKIVILLSIKLRFCKKSATKAVVIGLGNWGAQYLKFLSLSDKFLPVAAYDADKEKLNSLCKKYNIRAAASVEELCTNFGAEAIFVLTPTPTHFEVFDAVSKYGLPVYMEKPIGNDETSAAAMCKRAKDNGKLLYVAHSMKYEPIIQKTKELLNQHSLGRVTEFEFTRSVKHKGGGYYENAALYQIGVHLLDTVLFLFGEPNEIGGRETTVLESLNYETVCIKTRDGATGKLSYGFSGEYNFNFKVKTEKGVITYADSVLTAYVGEEKKQIKIPMINEKTVYKQLDEFFFAIKGQKYINTAENAALVVRLCDEIIKSGE